MLIAYNLSGYLMSMVEWLENGEQERIWKEVVVAYFKHCPNICLDGTKKTLENLSQDS